MSKKNRKIQISMEENHANVFSNGNGFDLIDLIVTLPEKVKQDFEKQLGFKIRNKEARTCCICGKKFYGYGCNANPVVVDGICCDECDATKVIPTRLYRMSHGLNAQITE